VAITCTRPATTSTSIARRAAHFRAAIYDAWRDTPVAVHDGVLTAIVRGRQAAIFVSRGGQP
jgi:hypothetical protein